MNIETRARRAYLMDSPGTLWIKARFYPDYDIGSREFIESEPVAVRFRRVGEDQAEVVKLWTDPVVAPFVQYGTVLPSTPTSTEQWAAMTKKAKDDLKTLITKYPNSPYAFYAWHALKQPGKWAEAAFEDLKDLRPGAKATVKFAEENEPRRLERARRAKMPFLNDARLDVKVTYEVAETTRVEEFLAILSKQSGVPLAVSPYLVGIGYVVDAKTLRDQAAYKEMRKKLKLGDTWYPMPLEKLKATEELRAIMDEMDGSEGAHWRWLRDGNGYVLTNELFAEKPAASDPKDRGRKD
ncbi:MAG: hypothetical protein HY000_05450 [Planctomycetes bacterium]|nr:hypothetical protein [Planctomycetota bacterium]